MRFARLAFTGLCLLAPASLGIAKEKTPDKQMDPQAIMDTYTKLAAPGGPHKQMARLAGSWNTTTKAWMDPHEPPMESKGSCEQTMLLGGRFLRQECTGDMMGQSFTGIGLNGYDNHTKKYVSTWMDSMGTAIYFMEGTASADGKTITQNGHYDDPVEGPVKLRSVTKIVDDNHEVFEMYGSGKDGKERKMMEITYTRKP
ncbi:DUF1579 domain-containing protein [Nitrospira sp. Nam80]